MPISAAVIPAKAGIPEINQAGPSETERGYAGETPALPASHLWEKAMVC